MTTTEQSEREQEARDELDYIISDEHGRDGENPNPALRVYGNRNGENTNVAPNACRPNQTVLVTRDGARYLVTITLLVPPPARRPRKGGRR